MDRLVYIASATAARLETAQAVAANNLANASTTGFKADLLASRAALLQGAGWDSRVYAPVAGTIIAINESLKDAPETLNSDAYATWLIKMQPDNLADVDQLLTGPSYLSVIENA